MTFSPLTKISPSLAIFTWFVLKGGPTVSILIFPGILQLTTGEASVRPYPWSVVNHHVHQVQLGAALEDAGEGDGEPRARAQ